ncbi:fluoride efflux transporter CrcB [Synechocystis sp. LKSZ1]|uniref:fluoride efflux transporter CrcB n=1 Tax=Synechocystis sp. LKSZ1 TaxID=3144951 RepID=UPI00336BE7A0
MALDPNLRSALAVTLGAIPGALSRYYLSLWAARWLGEGFPFGTFLVNVSGSFLMGLIVTLAMTRNLITPELRLLLTVGFLGSYTTFSTYALDTHLLLRVGFFGQTLIYGVGSLVLGVVAVELGALLARSLP